MEEKKTRKKVKEREKEGANEYRPSKRQRFKNRGIIMREVLKKERKRSIHQIKLEKRRRRRQKGEKRTNKRRNGK